MCFAFYTLCPIYSWTASANEKAFIQMVSKTRFDDKNVFLRPSV